MHVDLEDFLFFIFYFHEKQMKLQNFTPLKDDKI